MKKERIAIISSMGMYVLRHPQNHASHYASPKLCILKSPIIAIPKIMPPIMRPENCAFSNLRSSPSPKSCLPLCAPKIVHSQISDHRHHFVFMKLGNLQRHAIISNFQIWKSRNITITWKKG